MTEVLPVDVRVPDFPPLCSNMMRLEPCFSHVEMGSSAQQVVFALISFGPLQVEGTGELDGPSCKGYMDTWTFSSLFFPYQHCYYPFCPIYPSCFVVFISFRMLVGLWVRRLHTMYV
jgi:hypothetical protein